MRDYEKAVYWANCARQLIGVEDTQPITEFYYDNISRLLRCKKIKIFQYSELCQVGNLYDIIKIFGKDGAAVVKNSKKFIVLNDNFTDYQYESQERWYWTLIHELGHFMLGHLNDYDCIRLRSEIYDDYESEANVFTANFWMSEASVRNYIEVSFPQGYDYLDCVELAKLRTKMNVSWSALMARLDFMGVQEYDLSLFLVKSFKSRKQFARDYDACMDEVTNYFLNNRVEEFC